MILRSLLVSAALFGAAIPLQAQSLSKALSVSDVEMLLGMDSPELVAEMVREECVSFPLDAAATSRLRAAGADEALLGVVRTACFTGAELVVESDPAGAEVLVGNQRVGTTPWTGRYAAGGQLRVEVKRQGRTHSTAASLRAGQRTRARFSFAADTVRVPEVRRPVQVARQLSVLEQWSPPIKEPKRPTEPSGGIGDLYAIWAGTAVAVTAYCYSSASCGEEGGSQMESAGMGVMIGGLGGFLVAAAMAYPIEWYQKSSYKRTKARHEEWTRSMAVVQNRWIESHPEVLSAIAKDKAAQREAQEHNARVRARNAAQAPVRVTTEMLPGRVTP